MFPFGDQTVPSGGSKVATRARPLDDAPSGIGGWLVLGTLSLILTGLLSIIKAIVGLAFSTSPAWLKVTTPGSAFHEPSWKPLVAFDGVARCVLFVACILLTVSLFQKRRGLPRLVASLYAVNLVVAIVAVVSAAIVEPALLSAGFSPDAGASIGITAFALVRATIAAGVWIPYFLVSRRVKNTFTKPWGFTPPARGPRAPVEVAEVPASEAEPESFDMEELRDVEESEGFLPGSGYVARRSVSAQPEQVKHAADEWAAYSGWFPVTAESGSPVYRWGRWVWLSGDTRMRVLTYRKGKITGVRFEIGLKSGTIPLRQDYAQAAEYFADGVSSELAFQTMAVSGDEYEEYRRRRERVRRVSRIYETTYWLAPAAIIPVTALVCFLTWNALAIIGTASWMVGFWTLNQFLRARHIGMRVTRMIILIVIFAGFAIGFTLGAIFGGQ
jgi:hypothetical protein